MGIKSLHKLLKKQAAEAYREISLSEYSFRKVAVDASLFLYKYKAAAGDRWLSALLNLIMCLRRNDVHCFFVYDGKPPDEKIAEKERRAGEKEKLREKVAAVEYALNLYTRTGEVEQILLDITARRKKSPTKVKRLMGKEKAIDKFYLERYLERLTSYKCATRSGLFSFLSSSSYNGEAFRVMQSKSLSVSLAWLFWTGSHQDQTVKIPFFLEDF